LLLEDCRAGDDAAVPGHRDPTVLFDLGNVLVRLDFERGLSSLRRLAPGRVPASLDEASLFFSEHSLACNSGRISAEQFLDRLGRQLGNGELSRARLAEAWCDIFERWPRMERLAEQVLSLGHRAFLLSNTDPLHFAFLRERIPVLSRLDGLFLSYEAHRLKPDPTFFSDALERFGLEAGRCLYLDDKEANVLAARSVGLRAAVVRPDPAEAVELLRANGVEVDAA
jgi:HAD superfamily hydrolase (TIGR01509 family)